MVGSQGAPRKEWHLRGDAATVGATHLRRCSASLASFAYKCKACSAQARQEDFKLVGESLPKGALKANVSSQHKACELGSKAIEKQRATQRLGAL